MHHVGPHRGYRGEAEYDADATVYHGRVVGIRDVVTFETPDRHRLEREFADAVDDYLAMCAERGEAPDVPT